MSFTEIVSNAQLLVLAGSETTASLLSSATYYLATNSEPLAKLADDVRSTFNSDLEINLVNTQSLKYLHAVIEESLRIMPPAVAGSPRMIAKGGDTIAGHFLPEGVSSGICTRCHEP